MQKLQSSMFQCCSLFHSKTNSLQQSKKLTKSTSFAKVQFSNLSCSMDLSNTPYSKRISPEALMEYIDQVLENIYTNDSISFKTNLKEFIRLRFQDLKSKISQRLSLLRYLQQSLKYKSFPQIDVEIQKEWKKNSLLYSISTIWSRCMLMHQFKNQEGFVSQYEKYRNFISNISQYFFKNSLKILISKKVQTLTLIFEETSHQIINNLKQWKNIYDKFFKIIKKTSKKQDVMNQQEQINMDYDLTELKVNRHYLNPNQKQNQLEETTLCIQQLAKEFKINQKIILLQKIRKTFVAQLTQNSKRIIKQTGVKHLSQLQKDDILDCMIYCIIKGQIIDIATSLKALMLLVGKDSEFLAKKGVDSYRADLQGAIQYLCHDQMSSSLKIPRNLLSTQVTSYTTPN